MRGQRTENTTRQVVFATILACACEVDDDLDGTCAQRMGTDPATYVERTGTCGGLVEEVMTLESQPVDVVNDLAPCTSGHILCSANNCDQRGHRVDGIKAGATSNANGKYDWDRAGDRGTGILNLAIRNASGEVLCQSSYEVTTVRL